MHFRNAALAAASIASTVKAHMFINSPGTNLNAGVKDPLNFTGNNFPCHSNTVNLPTSGGTSMAAGSSQLLSWELDNGANTAVHGGGSCQISITYETDPQKLVDPKNWKVIYSIEEGCPTNSYQNLDGNYVGPQGSYTGAWPCSDPKTNGVDCVNSFPFTIPKGVANGHVTLAWTWFNTVGNREIYMNCVSAELTGGDGSEIDEFPTMFMANLVSVDQCPTTASVAVAFPYPGKYATTKMPSGEAAKTASKFPVATPTGGGCSGNGAPVAGSGPSASSASKAGPASQASSTSKSESSAAAPAPSSSSSSSFFYPYPTTVQSAATSAQTSAGNQDGSSTGDVATVTTVATVTGAAPSSAASATAWAPDTDTSPAPAPVPSSATSVASLDPSSAADPAPAPASSTSDPPAPMASSSAAPSSTAGSPAAGSSSDSCDSGSVSCPNPGSVICIGSSQFGICDINNCAVPQALAAGTHCSGGQIMKRSHPRHARRHRGTGS